MVTKTYYKNNNLYLAEIDVNGCIKITLCAMDNLFDQSVTEFMDLAHLTRET